MERIKEFNLSREVAELVELGWVVSQENVDFTVLVNPEDEGRKCLVTDGDGVLQINRPEPTNLG